MSENKFRFKKDGIEIELSGDIDYLNHQINNWKPFIEKLSFSPITEIENIRINTLLDTEHTEKTHNLKADFLGNHNTNKLFNNDQENIENTDKFINTKSGLDDQLNSYKIKVTKNVTLEEFFELKNPKTETDKVIVAAYYFERYNKYESFSELDLYSALNIPGIENHLLRNMENGYLSISENKNNLNYYTLTYLGEIYIREEIGYV